MTDPEDLTHPACSLSVSNDRLKVFLAPYEEGSEKQPCPLSTESVLASLAEQGITVGVDKETVAWAVSSLTNNPDVSRVFTIVSSPALKLINPDYSLTFHENTVLYSVTDEEGNRDSATYPQVELVAPGTVLAKATGDDAQPPRLDVFGETLPEGSWNADAEPVCGPNVEFIEDDNTFRATAYGYPYIEKVQENDVPGLRISVDSPIWVSLDVMSASFALRPLGPGENVPKIDTLTDILQHEKVVFGVLHGQLEKCLELLPKLALPTKEIVAMGINPVDGIDARLKFHVEVGPLPGKLRGDGSIDYRERKMFVGVGIDELIAVKIPSTPGRPGTNVHGGEIAQKPGKDFVIKVTDDAIYDESTGEVRAARSGVLSMVSENSVKVCARQVVSGDVDYSTGNIISSGALEIRGGVRPQFKVVAMGDISVGANVENASIRVDANIICKQGVVGQDSKILARGDADLQFLEHGRVFARGNVVLRKSCYYCRLHSWKDISCPPESRIIGSQIIAAGSLVLGNIGDDHARPAILGANIDPTRFQQYLDNLRLLRQRQEEYDQLYLLLGADSDSAALVKSRKLLKQVKSAVQKASFLPGTESGEDHDEQEQVPEQTITVHGKIYRGTEIRIGNQVTEVDQTMSKVRFRVRLVGGKGPNREAHQEIVIKQL